MVTSGLHTCVHTHVHTHGTQTCVPSNGMLAFFCFLLSYLAPELGNIVINRLGEGRGKERNEGQKGERRLCLRCLLFIWGKKPELT